MKATKELKAILLSTHKVDELRAKIYEYDEKYGEFFRGLSARKIKVLHYNLKNNNLWSSKRPICPVCNKNKLNHQPGPKVLTKNCSSRCLALSPEFQAKCKATNLRRYGSENISGSKIIKAKKEKTLKRRYGVTNSFQIKEVREAITEKVKERYEDKDWLAWRNSKVKEAMNRPETKARQSAGVRKAFRRPEVRANHRKACRLRDATSSYSRFTRKTIEIAGREFSYQGYESVVLEYLINDLGIKPSKIFTDRSKVDWLPDFEYESIDGEPHTYYPDIFVKQKTGIWVIEVKSTWTLGLKDKTTFRNTRRKAKSVVSAGYKTSLFLCSKRKVLCRINGTKNFNREYIKDKLQTLRDK